MKKTLDLRSAALQCFVKFIGGTLLGLATLVATIAVPAPAFADASSCGTGGIGMPNPASVYCNELGYRLEAAVTEDGKQYRKCVFPDGNSCDSWSFLRGECGAQYSYCAKQGYDQITKTDGKNSFSPHYAVCVERRTASAAAEPETAHEIGSVTDLIGWQHRYKGIRPDTGSNAVAPAHTLMSADALPLAFDWRNHNGQDWMTSVKDQSACGACWAFSAIGATEAVYNIATNFPDLDLDLSEEFLNSDCPSPNPGSCCGGNHTAALDIIKVDGIPDETCMPFDVGYYDTGSCDCFGNPNGCPPACSGLPGVCSHLTCADRCGDWATGLVTIDGYTKVPEDLDQIKQAVKKGPLSVCLAMSGAWDGADVYRCTACWDGNHNGTCETSGVCGAAGTCTSGLIGDACTSDAQCDEDINDDGVCTQDDCWINHCVVIAGYDDANGAWIVKNSWGNDWPSLGPVVAENGYWRVGYGECHIEEVVYAVEPAEINFPPVADANGLYNQECDGAATVVALDGSGSADPNGDPLTYAWTTDCSGGSFDDDTSATPTLTVDTSTGGCFRECGVTLTVTDDEGSSDSAMSSVTISDTTPPAITPPANVTVECDASTDPSNTGTASAIDTCNETEISHSDSVTGDSCNKVITRTWTATDSCGNSNSAVQSITVVDTTPPDIACNAPATITPADVPVSFTATSADNCDANPMTEVTGYSCYSYTKKGKEISKTDSSCMVSVDGDTVTILDSGGVGDIIQWTTRAVDQCGNENERSCQLEVVKKGGQ